MPIRSNPWHAAAISVCGFALAAFAQVPPPPANAPGLPAPMTDSSSGAIINTVPATPRIDDPVPARPVVPGTPANPTTPTMPTARPVVPSTVVPSAPVNPAAGVVPTPPGATGPILRPEIGRSNIDNLQTSPSPGVKRNPADNATNSLSPADKAQRQLMIEREDRMRGLNKVNP
ncbi:MAG: hypothetical protein JWP29_1925 [Rhodoferax sp.]|nr:hypothetical protein [Rhodoferax sp.]